MGIVSEPEVKKTVPKSKCVFYFVIIIHCCESISIQGTFTSKLYPAEVLKYKYLL